MASVYHYITSNLYPSSPRSPKGGNFPGRKGSAFKRSSVGHGGEGHAHFGEDDDGTHDGGHGFDIAKTPALTESHHNRKSVENLSNQDMLKLKSKVNKFHLWVAREKHRRVFTSELDSVLD